MLRFEISLLTLSGIVWTVSLGVVGGFLPLGDLVALDLYRFFSVAAVLGWLSGNVYVLRRRALGAEIERDDLDPPPSWRRQLLFVYVAAPPSLVMLLWALAPASLQRAAPLVPVYALAIFGLFFLVPLTLGGSSRPRYDSSR